MLKYINFKYYNFIILLICLVYNASAIAALPVGEQEQIERQQKELIDKSQQQREALQSSQSLIPETEPLSLPSEAGPCQFIQKIEIRNSSVLTINNQRKILSDWEKRCLNLNDIRSIARQITAAYLERGFITSQAWIPQQDITGGTLIIEVTEGRIESITRDGAATLALKTAFPLKPGSLLNLRDLEQGLDQLNRLTSQPVTIDIQAGTLPGYSLVIIQDQPTNLPLSAALSLSNSGQRSTGTGQLNLSLTLDNPLRIADSWSFSAGRDSEFHQDRRSRNLAGNVSIPWGYWLLGYQVAWNDFYQHIPVSNTAYRYAGDTLWQKLNVNRVLLRDSQQKLSAELALSQRRSENRLADQRLKNSSHKISTLSSGLNYSRTLAGGYLTLNPQITKGITTFGATRDSGDAPGLPQAQFIKASLNSSYYLPLTPSIYYLTAIYGQISPDHLYSSEQVTAGGQYSVRGFKEQSISANRGAYWRNDINWRWPKPFYDFGISIYGAIDAGWLQEQKPYLEGGSLAGAAIGINVSNQYFSHAFSGGVPLFYPGSMKPDKWVVYWQASLSL